jgi:hypothetical protein
MDLAVGSSSGRSSLVPAATKVMRRVTRSPKIMDIRHLGAHGDPGFYSANIYADGGDPTRYDLADYLVPRNRQSGTVDPV